MSEILCLPEPIRGVTYLLQPHHEVSSDVQRHSRRLPFLSHSEGELKRKVSGRKTISSICLG